MGSAVDGEMGRAEATASRPAGAGHGHAGNSAGLILQGLRKLYGGRPAVDGAGFSVRPGEFLAVLGPSGAGKTTLFRCIAGLTRPDAGAVRLDGKELLLLRGRERRLARRRIAVIFQQFNLVRRLTALENVLAGRLGYVRAWRGWLRRFSREDMLFALECLDRVGLLDNAGQRADTLSGGQQQRVAIARALVQQPAVILADEPVASLDPQNSEGILALLRAICAEDGVAVVCSLHQVHLARAYADRILGLAGGRVVVDLPADQFDSRASAEVYAR